MDGIHPASSKSPSFANILQTKDNESVPETMESQPNQKKKARPRGQVHSRILPSVWEKYKEYLKKLYIEEQMTTLQIKEYMKSKLDFDAS